MDLGQQIVIYISVFLVLWYFIFSMINRRRGLGMYHWLRAGLEQLGEVSQAAWIGSSGSGARLVLEKPEKPFQRIEAIYLLESREILPLWIFNRLRGRRDELILKAALRGAPAVEIEAGHSGDRDLAATLAQNDRLSYNRSSDSGGLEIAWRGHGAEGLPDSFRQFVNQYPQRLVRVSLQRKSPHLIVRLQLPDVRTEQAADFFAALSGWLAQA